MTPNPKFREIIMAMGIIPEDEHYDVSEAIVRKCADFIDETAMVELLLGDCLREHFGVEE